MKKRQHTKKFLLSAVALAALVAFIWGNSLLPQAQSQVESSFVLELITRLLGRPLSVENAEHFIRKLAHFTEYAALGFTAGMLFLSGRRGAQRGVNALSLCLAVAVADESLQTLTDRGAVVTDILLDFSGALFGFLVFLGLRALVHAAQRARKRARARA